MSRWEAAGKPENGAAGDASIGRFPVCSSLYIGDADQKSILDRDHRRKRRRRFGKARIFISFFTENPQRSAYDPLWVAS
jgi:hypothetical protein